MEINHRSFNATDKTPFTHDPSEIITVYKPSDLGTAILAPDGVMRVPLVNDTRYVFHKSMTLPRLLMPKVIVADNFELVHFTGARTVTLSFDGNDTPHIWGREVGVWFVDFLIFNDISNADVGRGTILHDFVGGGGVFSLFVVGTVAYTNFKQIARLVDMGIFQTGPSQDFGNASGITARITPALAAIGQSHSISTKRFLNSATDPDNKHSALTFIGDTPECGVGLNLISLGKQANSFIHIDSGTTQGNYNLLGNSYRGISVGEFFRPDLVIGLTAQENTDIAIISFANSTVNPGVDTTVNFGSIVDFTRGQVILIADATQGSLNGTHTIVRVADDQKSFDISVVFSTNSTANLKMVKHTVAVNKFTRDETVTISGTTNYNGTHQILRETDTTFHLPQAFIANEATGTATSTGKDCKDLGINCVGNGAEEDSRNIGSYIVNNSVAVTTLGTLNAWEDLNLGGNVITASNIENFTVVNTTTGEIRYDGIQPFSGIITFTAYVASTGGSRNFKIRAIKNGSPLPDTFEPVQNISSSKKHFMIIVPVILVSGDLIRPQALRATDPTSNLTVSDLTMDIS